MARRLGIVAALLLVALGTLVLAQTGAQTVDERFEGRVAAPEFPTGLDWFNVPAPLTMDGLRGKIVVLDFWTYGCINCIHMIPVLEQIEQKFADEVVVIGVHSAKFENEGQSENIREIVQRYNVHHPVVNDRDFRIWGAYGVRAWPSFAVIDPRGNVTALQAGEVPFDAFDAYLSGMVDYYDNLGADEIDRTPLALALEGAGDPGTPLLFPGKVLADAPGGRLFIADTNHHRIVIADLTSYEVLATIGTGERGFSDGDYGAARFNQPQGMALSPDGGTLYVADVNNHAIRAVDLAAQQVRTIAGTGSMGRGIVPFETIINEPLAFDLRSPWALALNADGSLLDIAMAGTHQLWQMDLNNNLLRASVGNGREAQLSTTLADSELAQPSGLFRVGSLLYFADSESSTVRVADFARDAVRVIAGTTQNNLFDFGDRDGAPGDSRLQHALGVTGTPDGAQIFIADTYNSKLRVYDPVTDRVTTLAGSLHGYRDGALSEALFFEPGGLSYAEGKIYVADTNNHALRVVDLEAGTVSTVVFPNPQALKIERNAVTVVGGNAAAGEIQVEAARSGGPGEAELVITYEIPLGFKLNPLIASSAALSFSGAAASLPADSPARFAIEGETLRVPLILTQGESEIRIASTLYYCEAEEEAFCLIDDVEIVLTLVIAADGTAPELGITRRITLPEVYRGGF